VCGSLCGALSRVRAPRAIATCDRGAGEAEAADGSRRRPSSTCPLRALRAPRALGRQRDVTCRLDTHGSQRGRWREQRRQALGNQAQCHPVPVAPRELGDAQRLAALPVAVSEMPNSRATCRLGLVQTFWMSSQAMHPRRLGNDSGDANFDTHSRKSECGNS
jgi:hypothetical protein